MRGNDSDAARGEMTHYGAFEQRRGRSIEGNRRFIEKPDRPAGGKGPRKAAPSRFPLRKMSGLIIREMKQAESIECSFDDFNPRATTIVAPPKAHIFNDGQARFYPIRMADIVEVSVALGFGGR